MVDTSVILLALKNMGHNVTDVTEVPANAGEYEFTVDGRVLTLSEVRALLAEEESS